MSNPLITPKQWLGHDNLISELAGCSCVVMGFCHFNDMKIKLSVEPLPKKLFSQLDQSHQFIGHIGENKILALECLYGGPLTATVLEELAYYGLKTVIGYGYAGSLWRNISIGQIVLAKAAIVSDGTSREYLPEVKMVYPDPKLSQRFKEIAGERNILVEEKTVWTTDAVYREYPEKIKIWKGQGADIVNMDSSYLYAVSQVLGISSIYACVISDCVDSPSWDEGFARTKKSMNELREIIFTMGSK